MVNKILTATGLPYKESRFLSPPKTTYAVYDDDIESRGGDYINLIKEHNVTIELYEYEKDPEAEKSIENQFNLYGLEYTKQSRYWLNDEQLYLVVYEFNYIDKGGQE